MVNGLYSHHGMEDMPTEARFMLNATNHYMVKTNSQVLIPNHFNDPSNPLN
jgi:hypothetical protein